MKKLVSFALAVIAVLCLSIPAFATEVTEVGDYTAEVTGNYVAGTKSNNTVYCIDITWKDLDMTYHAANEAVWDTDNLEYSVVTSAYWDGEGTITVTNRSNTRISAVPTYTALEGYSDADMTFSTSKLKVSSAELGTEGSGSITVTPKGSLPDMEEATTIGTITLTIEQDPDATVEEAEILVEKAETLQDTIGDSIENDLNKEEKTALAMMVSGYHMINTCLDEIENNGLDENAQKRLNDAYNDTLEYYIQMKQIYNNYVSPDE